MKRRAFTLIELLVVITIIVVILALLMPAISEAVYQAELVACAAQLDTVAGSTILYAHDYARRYPNRVGWNEQSTFIRSDAFDLRKIVKGYILPNHFQCPLSPKVDLNPEANASGSPVYLLNSTIHGSYDYWSNWRYTADENDQGMDKLGDAFTWTNKLDTETIVYTFDLLASDREVIGYNEQTQSTHPDRDGKLHQVRAQNQPNPWGSVDTFTIGWWRMWDHRRGLVDRNFAASDGSVQRLANLVVQPGGGPDERLVTAPMYTAGSYYQTGGTSGYYTALPRAR